MTIKKSGALYWWYSEWVRRGGPAPPRMNLCHFVRVLTVWGPARWFFCQRQEATLFVHLAGFTQLVLILAGVALCAIVWIVPWMALKVLGVIFATAGGMTLLFGVGYLVIQARDAVKGYNSALQTYRDYRAAQSSRVCPMIDLEGRNK